MSGVITSLLLFDQVATVSRFKQPRFLTPQPQVPDTAVGLGRLQSGHLHASTMPESPGKNLFPCPFYLLTTACFLWLVTTSSARTDSGVVPSNPCLTPILSSPPNERNELTNKTVRDSKTESRVTAAGGQSLVRRGKWNEPKKRRKKKLVDTHNSVMDARGGDGKKWRRV